MIVYAAKSRQTPARRNMARMEEQRAFDWAFPAIFERNIANRNSVAPMHAARLNGWQVCAANEGKLTFLQDNPA